jgi:spermidine/putrescine transport system ATP-binding protein
VSDAGGSVASAAAPRVDAADHGQPDVRLVNLTKRFDGDVVAVDNLSLDIERGRFVALLGPSGCGKTTTLRMIGGFEEPTAGQIMLGDRDVAGQPAYKRDVNTVFQSYALFPHLSSYENVAFGLRRRSVKGDELRRRTLDALELVGLAGMEKRKPRQMSGGQQQRIALARALVNRPRVLLLDEPLGALDLKLRKQMQLELKSIQREVGLTFIHVTHDQEEAMTMADQIVVMNNGKIEQAGSAEELYENPRTAFVASFLGVSNLLDATVTGEGEVRLSDGSTVAVPSSVLAGHSGELAIGIRPEKIHVGDDLPNRIAGTVAESAYIGVSTQYIVDTPAGLVTVYVQNGRTGSTPHAVGDPLTLSWSPECTFIVERREG